jgi:hypothetical protein
LFPLIFDADGDDDIPIFADTFGTTVDSDTAEEDMADMADIVESVRSKGDI